MKGNVFKLQFLRSLIATGITLFICHTVDLGTHPGILAFAVVSGVLFSGYLLQKPITTRRVVFYHLGFLALGALLLWCADIFVSSGLEVEGEHEFLIYRIGDHLSLTALFYLLGFLGTWFFWSKRETLSFEVITMSAFFIWFLSGHRNYYLDAPKQVSETAWLLGVAPEHFLLSLGVLFTLILGFYLSLSTDRPLLRGENVIEHAGQRRKVALFATPFLVFLFLVGYAAYVNKTYSANISRATNGVGDENQEGTSPLGFHSAIGKTKQPAALVRLEGDYAKNPWTPMLYLREGALSTYNGNEFVIAPPEFDTDVPRIRAGEPWLALEKGDQPNREKLIQSVYLLAKHNAPFALDYPASIRLIKNPDKARFELAYQAVSVAPTTDLKSLIGEAIGDPNWSEATWAHYLRSPGSLTAKEKWPVEYKNDAPVYDDHGEDLRYGALAKKLTAGVEAPILKAATISQFLSAASIYTRKPGHTVSPKGDPVAPYLFSDEKRGYCVHFSHAAVYLMRLAGIPARIATGYLTDLSYAKDGHILLHLGDRHAWPEIYVQGIGWTVVDVTPSQAENEQVLVPDEKLLEELMSKLAPAEELLPTPPLAPEDAIAETGFEKALAAKTLITLILVALVTFILIKLWLRLSWLLPSNPQKRLRRAYTSSISLLADLGIMRGYGETRREFAQRVSRMEGVDTKRVTEIKVETTYKKQGLAVDAEELHLALSEFSHSFNQSRSRFKRVLAFFSPLSIPRIGKW